MKKTVLLTLMIYTLSWGLVSLKGKYDLLNGIGYFEIGVRISATPLTLDADLYFCNDGKYYDPYHHSYYFGYYFNAKRGGLILKYGDLRFVVGRFTHKDVVESPYSLFISSEDIPSVMTEIEYSSENFFYLSRWVRLTVGCDEIGCDYDFDSRGANFRVIAAIFGNLSIGYEELAIYTKRTFDLEYFLNPIPNFFTQYINYVGRPFSQGTNDSSIMGFFATYRTSSLYAYAQILVDDFRMNRFYGGFPNPDKLAWSLGGKLKTPLGWVGFYHAGATKYTFEPSTASIQDGYTYFPAIVAPLGDATRMLLPEENYVGYKYGENNIAMMLSWESAFGSLDLRSYLELLIFGNSSPVNPWHESKTVPMWTHLLDDPKIGNRVTFSLEAEWNLEKFSPFVDLRISRTQNPLKVVPSPDGDGNMYVVGDGVVWDYSLAFGIRIEL